MMSSSETQPSPQDAKHVVDLLLKEYDALKTEQRARIGFRDGLLYTTIGVTGAIASVAMGGFSKGDNLPHVLLLIPWVTTILGWTYVVNDQKITAIRQHVEKNLAPAIARQYPFIKPTDIFTWEITHRKGWERTARKWAQFLVDILTFGGSGVAALAVFWEVSTDKRRSSDFYLVLVDGIILALLAIYILVCFLDATRDDPV